MILTGAEITKEVKEKHITIQPFSREQVNPNSYNYRIDDELLIITSHEEKRIKIPQEGFVLEPHQVYLASTFERLGSDRYAMSLIGRSSLGRLGLFLQVSANLGHTGSNHKWTLELVSAKPIRIYPHMIIGQISFWENKGDIYPYRERYAQFNLPHQSLLEVEK